jgi:cold shock protein
METLKIWHVEEGWGVLTSPGVPSDVFAHFSEIEGEGHGELYDGDSVGFQYRHAFQDGYAYLTTWVRRLD